MEDIRNTPRYSANPLNTQVVKKSRHGPRRAEKGSIVDSRAKEVFMTSHPPDTTFITVDQMRRTLKIGKNKALDLLASGAIDGIRVGRAVRVSQESLDRYIAANPYRPDDGAKREAPSLEDRT
jgi:excisionase family DNA binding protein